MISNGFDCFFFFFLNFYVQNAERGARAVCVREPRVVFHFFFFLFNINADSVRVAALSIALISKPLSRNTGFNLKPLWVFHEFRRKAV